MQKKQAIISPRSIQQDTAVSVFPNTSAYDMLNLRLVTTGENTSLCLTNEKGNEVIDILNNIVPITSIVIGVQVIDKIAVLFMKDESIGVEKPDYIVTTDLKSKENTKVIYNGNLGFSINNPIESIGIYENDKIQKVYWVDGKNSPRIININKVYKENNDTAFDFNPSLNKQTAIKLNVEVVNNTNGNFPAGVVQYVISYFNSYGQQTGAIYQSPLYYTSDKGRGLNPDGSQKSSQAFKLTIENTDSNFEYIKIYRILRTSLNTTPDVVELGNFKVKENKELIITYDTGNTGTSVDSSSLLFLGGDDIIASTISHKDNTLFLGNISNKSTFISQAAKDSIKKNSTVEFSSDIVGTEGNKEDLNKQWISSTNLNKGSNKITFFQKGETYRIGVQFLSKTGKWSESIFLKDLENTLRIEPNKYNDTIYKKPNIHAKINYTSLPNEYIAARLVCVYPTINDRSVLCQGLICPTVYNIEDRNDNSPYVQSSWFARPKTFETLNRFLNHKSEFSKKGSIVYPFMTKLDTRDTSGNKDYVTGLPSSKEDNGEIYCISSPDYSNTAMDDVNNFRNIFGVDERIVTFHSPELDNAYSDELYNISLDNVKFRIVGFSAVKTTLSDIKVSTNNLFAPTLSGMYNTNIEDPSSANYLSMNSMVNFPFWIDSVAVENETSPINNGSKYAAASYPIYPWHRKGSLSNQGKITDIANRKSILNSKTMSNLRICLPTAFFDKYFLTETSLGSSYEIGISNISLFNEDYITNKEIRAWGETLYYRGNFDKVLSFDGDGKYDEVPISVLNGEVNEVLANVDKTKIQTPALSSGSPVGDYTPFGVEPIRTILDNFNIKDPNLKSSDPIPMQYKSTGHAVFALNKRPEANNPKYEILPSITIGNINGVNESFDFHPSQSDSKLLWLKQSERDKFSGLYQKILNVSYSPYPNEYASSYFLIGELYRDNVVNRFGGDSQEALINNNWTVCGEAVYFDDKVSKTIDLIGDQGDTYYERYDHLKTYPYAEGNVNNIVDIVSFMCETRINIDGRYDKNRGKKNNLYMNPSNFNLFNKVYSQENNFFSYPYLDSNRLNVTSFPNQVLWSKSKVLGEYIDTWTSINSINSLDLDGDKGVLQSLNRLNNEIYAFQDNGISRILYNSRAMITPSDGVPIEIANGGKVEGKVYINDNYGCQNKWSIAEVPSGIYFIDNKTNGIYLFNGSNITNISDTKGMYSWVKKSVDNSIWNSKEFNNVRTLYDSTTGDVYFTTKDKALSFNEKIGAFSSFYSYGNVSWLINLNDNIYQVNNKTKNEQFPNLRGPILWRMHKDDTIESPEDRCKFFGERYPYYLKVVANPDFTQDKVIDTLEFRTNDTTPVIYNKANYYPFQTIEVSNEYQEALGDTSLLKKKFRTWRWQLPRAGRDRIRNPWSYITMTCNKDNSGRELKLYDIVLSYYI